MNNNNIQNIFFSKDNISNINKIVIEETKLLNASRETKQEIVNILIKNMKQIYKSIDLTKINHSNMDSILQQFKKHSIIECINDLNKSKIISTNQSQASNVKFQRDFNSLPNTGNKLMDRPEFTKNNITSMNNDTGQLINNMNNSNFNNVFKPIINDLSDAEIFNNYDNGRSKDINLKMDQIQQSRQTEANMKNNRPPTPDFIKSRNTNSNKIDTNLTNNINNNNNITNNMNNNNNVLNGLVYDMGDNLFSLENIDKPLINTQIEEDNSTFEERLKKLQNIRNNITIPQSQGNIDFTSDKFENTDSNIINFNNEQQKQPELYNQQELYEQQKQQELYEQQKQQELYKQQKQQELYKQQKQQELYEQQKQQELYEQQKQQELYEQQKLIIEHKKRQEQQKLYEQKQLYEQYKQQELLENNQLRVRDDRNIMSINPTRNINNTSNIIKLENENKMLKEMIEEYKLKESKILELKNDLSREFNSLKEQNEEYTIRYNNLITKEKKLIIREQELRQLINNNNLLKQEYYQLEITNNDNEGKYIYNLNESINNISSIKLLSYSIPKLKYNIEENLNNELIILIENEENIIKIETGKYEIEELIQELNNKLNIKNIKISINNQQKIIIESEIEQLLELKETQLSKINLGYLDYNKKENKLIADNIWDLRIEENIYLYLENLSDEIPFGILYPNGKQIISQFKFGELYNIDKLEIHFKNIYGKTYNFYNLSHKLYFLLE